MEILIVLYLILVVLVIAGMWKTFTKAGQPGWAAIIPIYNGIIILKIAGKPTWWILLWMFVPVVNLVIVIIASIAVAEKFGKSAAFGIGLVFLWPIFYAILGFGGAKYIGGAAPAPVAAPVESAPPPPAPQA